MAIIRPGPRARRREWAAQLRRRAVFERQVEQAVFRELRRAGIKAANAYRGKGKRAALVSLGDHPRHVRALLERHYKGVMGAFGQELLDSAKAYSPGLQTKDAESDFARLVREWVAGNGLEKATRIGAATRKKILAAILAGEEAGEGVAAIATRVREASGGVVGRFRAKVIARTEVHAASQASQSQALDALNLPEVKREWVSAQDERTRASHISADGQIRAQDKPFNVGGAALAHPGDPNGPPAETIQCRCISAAVITEA